MIDTEDRREGGGGADDSSKGGKIIKGQVGEREDARV